MNEILPGVSCQDAYVDALTLGPSPGIMDGCDITIERADVLMQFAIGQTGEQYWGDREYPMRPGTRHVDNVCGARFRNAQTGADAIVTAALTGPATPRLEPIIPLPATGIGDVLVAQTLAAAPATQTFGPFDIGDWPYLLMGLGIASGAGGARMTARYPLLNQALGSFDQIMQTLGFSVARCVPNLIGEASIQVDQVGGVAASIFAAPCAFPRAPMFCNLGSVLIDTPANLFATPIGGQVVAANSSINESVLPYAGVGSMVFTLGVNGGPFDVYVYQLDHNGNLIARLFNALNQPVSTVLNVEFPTVAAPMQLTVINHHATVAGAFTAAITVKEYADA